MKSRIVILGALVAAAALAQEYTPQGDLMLPKDYRQWVFLSSSIGMSYSETPSANPSFDNVFANTAAYQAFLKTGAWPDKTVLVMEVRSSQPDPLGKDGKYQDKVVSVEVHVKDAKHGGWSFYAIRPGQESGKAFAKTAVCYTCHENNGATDTTFVQFYPTLIDAAVKNGTFKKTEK